MCPITQFVEYIHERRSTEPLVKGGSCPSSLIDGILRGRLEEAIEVEEVGMRIKRIRQT